MKIHQVTDEELAAASPTYREHLATREVTEAAAEDIGATLDNLKEAFCDTPIDVIVAAIQAAATNLSQNGNP